MNFTKEKNFADEDREKAIHGNEALIHGLMMPIMLQLKFASIVATEIESGLGRADFKVLDESKNKK